MLILISIEYCIARGFKGVDQRESCGPRYSYDDEETSEFCTKWNLCRKGETVLYPEYWTHQTSRQTGSYSTTGGLATYSGGGYIAYIGSTKGETDQTLDYLYKNSWLDDFSRALLIDFTAYNTHANFYVMVTLITEFSPAGGAVTSKRVLTTRLDRYTSAFSIFLGICEIAFLCCTVYYMYREIKKLKHMKWKYLKDWRNWLEIFSFSCVWASFGLMLVRFGIVSHIKSRYFKDRTKYTNFENAAISDQVYGSVLSFVTLLMYLKFLKILRFNKRVSLMVKTVMYATTDLKYFSIIFGICFLSFAQLGYLFFQTNLEEYATFLRTIETLFSLILGTFQFDNIVSAKSFYGRLFFISFVFMTTYILMNMFITILIDSFIVMNEKMQRQQNKYELIDFIKQRFFSFIPTFEKRKNGKRKRVDNNTENEISQNAMATVSHSPPKKTKKTEMESDKNDYIKWKENENSSFDNEVDGTLVGANTASKNQKITGFDASKNLTKQENGVQKKFFMNRYECRKEIFKKCMETKNTKEHLQQNLKSVKNAEEIKDAKNERHIQVTKPKPKAFSTPKKSKKSSKETKRIEMAKDIDIGPNPMDALEAAIDRIDRYVDNMLAEEELDIKILEWMIETRPWEKKVTGKKADGATVKQPSNSHSFKNQQSGTEENSIS